ncbi:MAG: type II CAAX endopeptidase family protein [Acidobacteria bacterium]|nr:type II CAAX endopeptidase family protein [Acidobacteriota bacterium]
MEFEPLEPQPSPMLPEDVSVPVPPRRDMWSYWDLLSMLFFAAVALGICAALAAVASAALGNFFGIHAPLNEPPYLVYWSLGIQAIWWALVFAFIYYIVSIKYRLPFLTTLGFTSYRAPTLWFVILGAALAFAVGLTGQLIGAPHDTPMMELLKDPSPLWLIGIFAVLLGPVTEEVAFRGFLFLPLERGMGAAAAIIITSAVFTAPHGAQYGWSWQILLLLFAAGASFGFVRWKTGSLWPAIVMHIAYNGLQFGAFFAAEQYGVGKVAP